MIPIIVLVGRTNVGKSTLFNKLTKTNNALIDKKPHSTRDRQYGQLNINNKNNLIIDTAGIDQFNNNHFSIEKNIFHQTEKAIQEANLILFIINMQEGITFFDKEIILYLKKFNKSIFLIVNKIDQVKNYNFIINECYCLGIKKIALISALYKKGINILIEKYLKPWIENFKKKYDLKLINNHDNKENIEKTILLTLELKISIIGQPNVGKSTLINNLLNDNRMVTYNLPGTTRDSIAVPIFFKKKKYIFIDTAGIKKKNKNLEHINKLSNLKTIKSISKSNVIILMIDAIKGICNQDISILNIIIDFGKSCIIIINKSEKLSLKEKINIKESLLLKNKFIKFIKIYFISALYEKKINNIFKFIDNAYKNSNKLMKASKLTKIMQEAIRLHPPILVKGKKIKLKYAHPGGYNPPTIIIHGNQLFSIPFFYKRYLMNFFQKSLKIKDTFIKIIFKNNKNPYI